jgi:predicted metalloendopeptidase
MILRGALFAGVLLSAAVLQGSSSIKSGVDLVKPAPVLDGFTGPQRFFMGWAAMWRSKVRDGYMRQWLLTLSYSPYEYRANGPVSHLPGFYEAFGVTDGDRLFRPPSSRVRMW